jgi:hypothetical protein
MVLYKLSVHSWVDSKIISFVTFFHRSYLPYRGQNGSHSMQVMLSIHHLHISDLILRLYDFSHICRSCFPYNTGKSVLSIQSSTKIVYIYIYFSYSVQNLNVTTCDFFLFAINLRCILWFKGQTNLIKIRYLYDMIYFVKSGDPTPFCICTC